MTDPQDYINQDPVCFIPPERDRYDGTITPGQRARLIAVMAVMGVLAMLCLIVAGLPL
jgi:hypothetical protein